MAQRRVPKKTVQIIHILWIRGGEESVHIVQSELVCMWHFPDSCPRLESSPTCGPACPCPSTTATWRWCLSWGRAGEGWPLSRGNRRKEAAWPVSGGKEKEAGGRLGRRNQCPQPVSFGHVRSDTGWDGLPLALPGSANKNNNLDHFLFSSHNAMFDIFVFHVFCYNLAPAWFMFQ